MVDPTVEQAEALLRRFAGKSRVEAYSDLAVERHGEEPSPEQFDVAEADIVRCREVLGLIGSGNGDEDVADGLPVVGDERAEHPHTPGPWRFYGNTSVASDERGLRVIAPTGSDIASVARRARDEANARLIAAAPDLLAACGELCIALATARSSEPAGSIAEWVAGVAAIEKATGEGGGATELLATLRAAVVS